MLTNIGFKRGKSCPCAFYHSERNIRLVVNADDFTALGYNTQLDWLKDQLSAEWTIKHRGRVGPGPNDDKTITILNRILEWTHEGIRYEAACRHVQFLLESLAIESNSKTLITPGSTDVKPLEGNRLTAEQSTMFRAHVARAIYLSQDRTDIQFAVKELSRSMATPHSNDLLNLERLGRYLLANPRVITNYKYQSQTNSLNAWSDSDWAECKRTRRSTSGTLLRLGQHWLKANCGTQSVIALSSGEAEYYAMVRTSSAALGLKALLNDLGHSTKITLLTDAAAAKGISQRTGLGKVRHLETSQLWLQASSPTTVSLLRKSVPTTTLPTFSLNMLMLKPFIITGQQSMPRELLESIHWHSS